MRDQKCQTFAISSQDSIICVCRGSSGGHFRSNDFLGVMQGFSEYFVRSQCVNLSVCMYGRYDSLLFNRLSLLGTFFFIENQCFPIIVGSVNCLLKYPL